jgi:hypothetical protein
MATVEVINSSSSTSASSEEAYVPLDIKIEQLNIIAIWNFKDTANTDHICTICRSHVMAPPFENTQRGSLVCNITQGKCGHCFHEECINAINKKGQAICPIDKTTWITSKKLDMSTFWKQLKMQQSSNNNTSNNTSNNTFKNTFKNMCNKEDPLITHGSIDKLMTKIHKKGIPVPTTTK